MTKLLSIQRAIANHHGFLIWNPFSTRDIGGAHQLHFYYFLNGERHVIDTWGKYKGKMIHELDRRLATIFYNYENGMDEDEDECERSTYLEF